MMIVPKEQLQAISDALGRPFSMRAIAYLREHHSEWCRGRDDVDVARHVTSVIAFARALGITRDSNVLWLIALQAEPGFSMPPTGYVGYRLTQRGFDEGTRVRNFAAALVAAKKPILISLDADLEAMERDDA
ncbi:hypothetical protein [Sorangium sp. So ce426]|uniref:hypothetical protein n=1 Tax=Sorangium sp. So ce426 TaxID=3133312 RepID=UPI003F5CB59D